MQTSKSLYGQTVQATSAVKSRTFADYVGGTAAAGAAAMGAYRTDANAGDYVNVEQIGTSLVIAGADLAQGAPVEVGASGYAVPHANGIVVGRAVHGGKTGTAVEVFLIAA